MRLIDEILNDINQAKQKITSVELEIGHASGPSNQVNILIQVENLLTYCHSRLSGIDPESLRPQGGWINWGKSGTPTYENYGTCSVCHEDAEIHTEHRNYCPNCGAKMRIRR